MKDSNKYPIIGSTSKKYPRGICRICKQPKSDFRVDIQVNEFRGDDDVIYMHKSCYKEVGSNVKLLDFIYNGNQGNSR